MSQQHQCLSLSLGGLEKASQHVCHVSLPPSSPFFSPSLILPPKKKTSLNFLRRKSNCKAKQKRVDSKHPIPSSTGFIDKTLDDDAHRVPPRRRFLR
ncbi:hypothetical protein COCVIDRAFT_89549 [Bipolaris victoriae FI3]|uniref:Uncharacterized protein n=1 Tax=Bipolaris victoriae (strain FI3) TaxID=930091 RepID=W7EJB5_BIPV3|nr:hypothetical protein COCVIDRAFT_89549 [Bipolaris victoriae FI3]